MSLRNGISWDTLAVGMGTSRTMLERHYSKFKVEDRAGAFSGRAKQREREQDHQERTEKERMQATINRLTQMVEALVAKQKEGDLPTS
jgi:hypothetical protein